MGVRFLALQSLFVAMQSVGACYAKYCTAMFLLLHSFVALQTLFVALFRAAFLHVKLHFFRKQPQPQRRVLEGFRKSPQGILEGAGGVLLTTMNQVYLASW